MLGYSITEMIGMEIVNIMDEKDSDELLDQYEARVSGKITRNMYEGEILTKSGRTIFVEFNACTIQFGHKPASLSFVRDISNRKALQKQAVEQKQMAEFFNDVLTHDINNFCQTMYGQIDTVLSETDQSYNPDHLKRLQSCKNNVGKISNIIDRVREMMHIKTIDPDSLKPVNLSEMILEAVEISHETFPNENIKITSDVPKDTYILANNIAVLIFINLLTNAIKHNDKDRIEISIKVSSGDIDGTPAWFICVSDNGPGIPENLRHRVFSRFTRFSKEEGKGLGLSIVSAFVTKLSGQISLSNNGDRAGLCAEILLPKA